MTATGDELRARLTGVWELVARTVVAEGNPAPSIGDDPVGYLAYTGSGHMSVGMTKRDRPVLDHEAATDAEGAAAWRTCNAYWGTYTVDTEEMVIHHHPVGSTRQEYVGRDLPRRFRFEGPDDLYVERFPSGPVVNHFHRVG